MNFTDKQIKLAGVIQPEGGAREFEQGLDLQGEGIRVLQNDRTIFEENTGDCSEDLQACELANNALRQDIEDAKQSVTPDVDPENPEGSGSWSRSVTSQLFGSVGPIENFYGPETMTSNMSLWYEAAVGKFRCKWVASPVNPATPGSWFTYINFRTRNPSGVIELIIDKGTSQGQTSYFNASFYDGEWTVEARRIDIRIYDVGGTYDEDWVPIGKFTISGTSVESQKYISEIITDGNGDPVT